MTSLIIRLDRFFDQMSRAVTGLSPLHHSRITPNLYLGGQYTQTGLLRLHRLGFTAIVSMRMHSLLPAVTKLGFHALHLPTLDRHAPKISAINQGVKFINDEINNGGKVYVHCHYGEGRGVVMVAAYLISTGMTAQSALDLIRKVRPTIRPTRSQINFLNHYANHTA